MSQINGNTLPVGSLNYIHACKPQTYYRPKMPMMTNDAPLTVLVDQTRTLI